MSTLAEPSLHAPTPHTAAPRAQTVRAPESEAVEDFKAYLRGRWDWCAPECEISLYRMCKCGEVASAAQRA